MNTLYYGDNLRILREYIKDETVDLIYLDPPYNSNRNYNVLFRDESGAEAEAQITAFEDTWHWNEAAERPYHDLILQADDVSRIIEAFRSFIGTNQMMAYLVMMAARRVELHRVLKPTGGRDFAQFTRRILDFNAQGQTVTGVRCWFIRHIQRLALSNRLGKRQ